MKSFCTAVFVAWTCIYSQAAITFYITAGDLRKGDGTLMPEGGLVLLVGSADVDFGSPRADYFVNGNDIVLNAWGISQPGVFEALLNYDLTGSGLSTGNPLRLYWFPDLTLSTYNDVGFPGETEYGFYWDPTTTPVPPQDGSSAWEIPADGTLLYELNFFTASQNGAYSDTAGRAIYTVAPVPEASNLIFGALALGLVAFRVVPQIRRKLAKS